MDEHDPLNLDGDAMRNPDHDDRVAKLRATIASQRKTLDTPRYKQMFDKPYATTKAKIVQWHEWAEMHIRLEGQPHEQGEYDLDSADFFLKAAEDAIEMVVDKTNDLISDIYD